MNKQIPFYVDEMIYAKAGGAVEKCLKFNEFVKNDVTCAFAFMTDIHNCTDYAVRSFYAIDEINKHYPLSFTCLCGDYLCNNANTTKDEAMVQHLELADALDNFKMKNKTMVLNGNHDINPFNPANSITHEQIYNILMKHHAQNFVVNQEDENSMYGYLDMEKSKIRAIFLDTSELETFAFGNKQINWFANVALNLPDNGWGILLFSHVLPVPSALSSIRVFGGDALWEVLCAFKNGTSYSASAVKGELSYSVQCDFTKRGKGDVIAYFTGHNHADRKTTVDGICAISTISAASDNMSVELSDDGTYHRKVLGSGEETAFSIVTVDRTKRKVSYIRCGAGPDFSCEY